MQRQKEKTAECNENLAIVHLTNLYLLFSHKCFTIKPHVRAVPGEEMHVCVVQIQMSVCDRRKMQMLEKNLVSPDDVFLGHREKLET